MCAGDIAESPESPDFVLKISPNPAGEGCNIQYTLAEDAIISLKLFTPDSRQVNLINEELQLKGDHSFKLNFDQVFSGKNYTGLILVKLQAGNNSATQKVLVVSR
jgi:hypothetical protein